MPSNTLSTCSTGVPNLSTAPTMLNTNDFAFNIVPDPPFLRTPWGPPGARRLHSLILLLIIIILGFHRDEIFHTERLRGLQLWQTRIQSIFQRSIGSNEVRM